MEINSIDRHELRISLLYKIDTEFCFTVFIYKRICKEDSIQVRRVCILSQWSVELFRVIACQQGVSSVPMNQSA